MFEMISDFPCALRKYHNFCILRGWAPDFPMRLSCELLRPWPFDHRDLEPLEPPHLAFFYFARIKLWIILGGVFDTNIFWCDKVGKF